MVVHVNYLEMIYRTMPIRLSGPQTTERFPVEWLVVCPGPLSIHMLKLPSSALPSVNTVEDRMYFVIVRIKTLLEARIPAEIEMPHLCFLMVLAHTLCVLFLIGIHCSTFKNYLLHKTTP